MSFSVPPARGPRSGRFTFSLTGEAEQKSTCQSPRLAGERPLTPGPPLPPAPGSHWEARQVLRRRGAACAAVSSAVSPSPGEASLVSA